MSGRHAMAIRLSEGLAGGYDEELNDVCLTFAESLVRLAGGVIAGVKPAALFSIPMKAFSAGQWRWLVRHALDEALRAYAESLPDYGVSLSVLYRTDRRVYLLVWRPEMLARAFEDPELMAILREAGYRGSDVDELIVELRRRLVAYYVASSEGSPAQFPHEIGVFLGYPAEDVRGFLEGREATCKGAWHAYGDAQVARSRFRVLEMHERRCRARFDAGESLGALFAPQMAS